MNLVYIGKIVNTHGIKGEVRIISNFEYKEKVFTIGNKLYLENNECLTIDSYRRHKNYDMITFNGIKDILQVNKYKGKEVYFNKEELNLKNNEYLDEDLIGLDVYYKNEMIGKISNIEFNGNRKLFVISDKLIPYNENFIESIDLSKNVIMLKNIEGLI